MPPIVAPQTAKAMARSFPRYTALSTDSEAGRIIAAATPCRPRAAISCPELPEDATRTLATANSETPETNISRRPTMSDSRPDSSSSEANSNA